MGFTVVVENDISQWADETGERYHFPRRYRSLLSEGTRLIHYKGKLLDKSFASTRISAQPHYFGTSVAGKTLPDPSSTKGDLFVEIMGYKSFSVPVPHRIGGVALEIIPPSRESNFWRDGVRRTDELVFKKVLALAGLQPPLADHPPMGEDDLVSSGLEGGKVKVWGTRYERDSALRAKAISIHGVACFACETEMGDVYGPSAKGYVHVHHLRPLHKAGGPVQVSPKHDLVPLCPNCHSIAHLGGLTRSINSIRALLGKQPLSRDI